MVDLKLSLMKNIGLIIHCCVFFYGLSNILGVIFVLGMVGYLTFTEHWWYLGVYVGGLILAKLIALLLRLLLYPLYRLTNDIPTFAEI